MPNSLVKKEPLSYRADADTDMRMMHKMISAGSNKRRQRERRTMDNARSFSRTLASLHAFNGPVRQYTVEEIAEINSRMFSMA